MDVCPSDRRLSLLTQFISHPLDKRGQVDVLYSDFYKVFDRVDHNILL